MRTAQEPSMYDYNILGELKTSNEVIQFVC